MKQIMKTKLWVVATVAVGLTFTACQPRQNKNATHDLDSARYADSLNEAREDRDDTINNTVRNDEMRDDADFLAMAYGDGLFEIEAAKLAKKNSSLAEVKDLASKIEEDQMKANEQISALATKNNFRLPTAMPEKKQSTYNELAGLTGKEFDKKYVKEMVQYHDDAIDEFEKKTKDANKTEIQDFAVKSLPVLTEHKAKAMVINEKTEKM